MAMISRVLASLTLQSHRQHRQLESRVVNQPARPIALETHVSEPEQTNQLTQPSTREEGIASTAQADGSELDQIELVPTLAKWDLYDNDLDPMAWPMKKKILVTANVMFISWLVQFASSVDAGIVELIEMDFGVGAMISSLATGLFLIGFAFGAPVAGPLSEIIGRNPIYLASLFFFILTTLGSALSTAILPFLFFRFMSGVFGSTPLVCAGGSIFDIWSPRSQLYAFPIYAAGGFLGMPFGPPAGAIMTAVTGNWKMAEWMTLGQAVSAFLVVLLFQPETCAAVILKWKRDMIVKRMSSDEREAALSSRLPKPTVVQKIMATLKTMFYRPIELSIHEPIIIAISAYLTSLYVIIFTLLPGYIYIFSGVYGMNLVARNLTFYGIAIGFIFALVTAMVIGKILRRHQARNRDDLSPEHLLYYAIIGAPAVPISLFIMAWTSKPTISFWTPLLASVFLGFGVLCVFFSSYQYIIYTYGKYAASGLVFITLARYALAGVMVVVGISMYEGIGIAWTLTTLAIVGLLLGPIPFALFKFGSRIRRWSRLSATTATDVRGSF